MLYSANCALSKTLIALTLLFYLPSAYAEVIDKMPTLSFIWGVAFASGFICFVATFFKRWLLILTLFPAAWFLGLFIEIHSPDVGPALLVEIGYSYINQVYLAAFSVVALGLLGWVLSAKKYST